MTEKIILVTGASRSGISLVASMIETCGACAGRTARSIRADRRGSMENIEIREGMIKPLFRGIMADPNGQKPLPSRQRCRELADTESMTKWWRSKCMEILGTQGCKSAPVLLVASSLICLAWPVWVAAFPKAQWVLVRRRDNDIIQSCMKTGFMSAYSTEAGWKAWLDDHKKRFADLIDAVPALHQVWPQHIVDGDLRGVRAVVQGVGLNWDREKVSNMLAPVLWKGGIFEVTD
jgi:hypothetical protein